MGLGVAYVISGDYAGWNFGLAQGGWGGMFLATLLMATMYLCMCFSLAELSSMIPTAGGGYGFARSAFGPWGGFLTGTAILIEYAIAPAAIAVFIGAYCESLFGIGGWMIYLAFYIIFIAIHIFRCRRSPEVDVRHHRRRGLGIGSISDRDGAALQCRQFAGHPGDRGQGRQQLPALRLCRRLGSHSLRNLVLPGRRRCATGGGRDQKNPKRDLPRGLIGAMLVLVSFALLILVIGPGGAGSNALLTSGNPLVEALTKAYGGSTWMGSFVNLVGLAGLIASFFSIIYAYSRQIFALSRAGYLPRKLSETNKSKAPVLALIIPGIIGFGLSLTGQGDLLILVAVFGATISYVLMMAAHITLRIRRPKMDRPYRTPGGIFTSGVALVLACIAVVAGFSGGSAGGDWRRDHLWSVNCLLCFLQSASLGSRHARRRVRGHSES